MRRHYTIRPMRIDLFVFHRSQQHTLFCTLRFKFIQIHSNKASAKTLNLLFNSKGVHLSTIHLRCASDTLYLCFDPYIHMFNVQIHAYTCVVAFVAVVVFFSFIRSSFAFNVAALIHSQNFTINH